MGQLLGVTAMEGVAIVIAAVVVFALALAVLRVAGIRSATRLRTADVAVLLVIGAVLGRAILGERPTLVGGIIALAVLIVPAPPREPARAVPPPPAGRGQAGAAARGRPPDRAARAPVGGERGGPARRPAARRRSRARPRSSRPCSNRTGRSAWRGATRPVPWTGGCSPTWWASSGSPTRRSGRRSRSDPGCCSSARRPDGCHFLRSFRLHDRRKWQPLRGVGRQGVGMPPFTLRVSPET